MSPFTNCRIVGTNANPDEYHKHGQAQRGDAKRCIGQSDLMHFIACPQRWLMGSDGEDESSESQVWGSLVDCLALTPDQFKARFAVRPETYTDKKTGEEKPWAAQSNTCKAWLKDHEDKMILKSDTYTKAKLAVARLHSDALLHQAMEGDHQIMMTGEYTDKATSIVVPVKALVDLRPKADGPLGKTLGDLKTCRSANPVAWPWECAKWFYDVQAWWYLTMHAAATQEDRPDWIHILSENQPPYQPGRRLMSSEMVDMGGNTALRSLEFYCQCLQRNQWPGFDDGPEAADYGGWTLIPCYDAMKARRLMPKFAEAPEAEPEESAVPS